MVHKKTLFASLRAPSPCPFLFLLFLFEPLSCFTRAVFNVFFVIIPNGKNITYSALSKEKFDLNLSISAKTRSVHNNIITFLVLFIMLSGHASFISRSQYNWVILLFLAIILGLIRHYFNLKAKKKS